MPSFKRLLTGALMTLVRGAAGPLSGLAKRETGRARSKEKGAWMRSGAVALRADGGRRTGACSDFA